MNIDQVKDVMNHVIKNNAFLEDGNKKKTTLCIEGPSGVGKTSVIEQIAQERGMHFVKKNLAELEETSELVGFPIREFETKTGEWLNEKHLDFLPETPKLSGKTRTSYCKPDFVPDEDDESGGLLLLDDFSRADSRLIQATMELVDKSSYASWSLPKGWTVVLSTNPDNGDYFVTSMDQAQSTRFIKINVDMDIGVWAKWAERSGIDSRCINFLLLNPEMINDSADSPVNARLATDFFNSISSIKDFSTKYDLITLLGNGSVGQEFTQTFIGFINGNLDKVPSPDKIFNEQDDDKAIDLITAACGKVKTKHYKQHIASLICSRLLNNAEKRLQEKSLLEENVDRTIAIMKSDAFSGDVNHHFYKTLNAITSRSVYNSKYTTDTELIRKAS